MIVNIQMAHVLNKTGKKTGKNKHTNKKTTTGEHIKAAIKNVIKKLKIICSQLVKRQVMLAKIVL